MLSNTESGVNYGNPASQFPWDPLLCGGCAAGPERGHLETELIPLHAAWESQRNLVLGVET